MQRAKIGNVMGVNFNENERHVIFNFDLYAGLHTKHIARNNYLTLTINERSLQ